MHKKIAAKFFVFLFIMILALPFGLMDISTAEAKVNDKKSSTTTEVNGTADEDVYLTHANDFEYAAKNKKAKTSKGSGTDTDGDGLFDTDSDATDETNTEGSLDGTDSTSTDTESGYCYTNEDTGYEVYFLDYAD
ncbi:MAG: hypothetical protein K6G11_06380, partial [Lachnospiraceae bacterium]|nr:hypothetical protein [Lachnospiraceae bacterium]